MGFPIFSLIITRIIGIPQSLLLRVFGIPQFLPGVYGIPHALLRLSPKAFFCEFFASYPFGYLVSSSLRHSKALFTDLTSVIPRGLPFFVFFVFLSPRNSRPTSCSEELSNFFELTRSIIDQDAQPSPGTGLLENSKDTQFTQRKKGISRRQKRKKNLFPPPSRCARKLSNDATVDLLSNCDDTDGD